jgi:hypothetical protein
MSLKVLNGINIAGAQDGDLVYYNNTLKTWQAGDLSTIINEANIPDDSVTTFNLLAMDTSSPPQIFQLSNTNLATFINDTVGTLSGGMQYILLNSADNIYYNLNSTYPTNTSMIMVTGSTTGSYINLYVANTSPKYYDITVVNTLSAGINIQVASISGGGDSPVVFTQINVFSAYGTGLFGKMTLDGNSSVRFLIMCNGTTPANATYTMVNYNGSVSAVAASIPYTVNQVFVDAAILT